mgnify:CR=1 FL=1
MTIHEMRTLLGDTQHEFAERYNIPFRTIQNWEGGVRQAPDYVLAMLEEKVLTDSINRRTFKLPAYDPRKKNLPNTGDYASAAAWLRDVNNILGGDVVFALDEALMCEGSFLGRVEEYLVWVYGDDSLKSVNGVTVLGSSIDPKDVSERSGLKYTSFNRTLLDAFDNESILDMQGITEALSRYYSTHNDSFEGLYIPPTYRDRFDALAKDAIEYYTY